MDKYEYEVEDTSDLVDEMCCILYNVGNPLTASQILPSLRRLGHQDSLEEIQAVLDEHYYFTKENGGKYGLTEWQCHS